MFFIKTARIGYNAMPFVATPNGVRVTLLHLQNTVPIVNVLHVRTPGAPAAADLADINLYAKDFHGAYKAAQHPSIVLQSITSTDISVANGTQVVLPITSGGAGTGTGNAVPANAAVVASLRTGLTGRSFRGRMYFGGLDTINIVDAQHIDPATAAIYAGYVTDFIDALQTAGYILSVLSTVANGVLRVAGILTEIVEVVVDTKIDSQRRRTAN